MELYVLGVLITASVIGALWLLALRIRYWKEQILHAVSIVESNNAIAHDVTRRELAQHVLSCETTAKQLDGLREQIQDSLQKIEAVENNTVAELAAVRGEVEELSKQTNLRKLVRGRVPPPRFIPDNHPPSVRFDEAMLFLRSVDIESENPEFEHSYLELHIRRLARTLDITPLPSSTRRALELGAYMQITPALACLLGYDEVRAAYFGRADQSPYRKRRVSAKNKSSRVT